MLEFFAAARHKHIRWLLVIATGACIGMAYACGNDSPTSIVPPPPPPPSLVCDTSSSIGAGVPPGTYLLVSVNGFFPPVRASYPGAVVDSGNVTLSADSSYEITMYTRATRLEDGTWMDTKATDAGRISRCGATIHFDSPTLPSYVARINETSFTALLPGELVPPGAHSDTLTVVYSKHPRSFICGDTVPALSLTPGAYSLTTVNGSPPPVTLPDSYPYSVTIASATVTISGSAYAIHARGSSDSAHVADAVVVSDSGTIVACPAYLHFASSVHESSFTVLASENSMSIPLPAAFINFEYDFFGEASPVALELHRTP